MLLIFLLLFETLFSDAFSWQCSTAGQMCSNTLYKSNACSKDMTCTNPRSDDQLQAIDVGICLNSKQGMSCAMQLNVNNDSIVTARVSTATTSWCSRQDVISSEPNQSKMSSRFRCLPKQNTAGTVCQVMKLPGWNCNGDWECEPLINGAGSNDTTTMVSGVCFNGKCFVSSEFAPCSKDDHCYDHSVQDNNLNVCQNKICLSRAGITQPCGTQAHPKRCQEDAWCDTSNFLCIRLKLVGQTCDPSKQSPRSSETCLYSRCNEITRKCVEWMSFALGDQVCTPPCAMSNALYCKSLSLDSITGKCVEWKEHPLRGISCSDHADCNLAYDSISRPPLSCHSIAQPLSTVFNASVNSVCVPSLIDPAVPIPFIPDCSVQFANLVSSCKLSGSEAGNVGKGGGGVNITTLTTSPYALPMDAMTACCGAAKSYRNCVAGEVFVNGINFEDSVLVCPNNVIDNFVGNVCNSYAISAASTNSINMIITTITVVIIIIMI